VLGWDAVFLAFELRHLLPGLPREIAMSLAGLSQKCLENLVGNL
jgi:hypothetical protein